MAQDGPNKATPTLKAQLFKRNADHIEIYDLCSPRWPQYWFKMASRLSQDGGKTEARRQQNGPKSPQRCSGIAYFPGWPKMVKIGVSCKRGAIFGRARLNFCCTSTAPKLSPPSTPPTLRDRVGTTKHVTSYILFRYM